MSTRYWDQYLDQYLITSTKYLDQDLIISTKYLDYRLMTHKHMYSVCIHILWGQGLEAEAREQCRADLSSPLHHRPHCHLWVR